MFGPPKNKFTGVLALEESLPRRMRETASRIINALIFLFFIPLVYSLFLSVLPENIRQFAALPSVSDILPSFWIGIILLLLIPRLTLGAIDAYANSKTFDIRGDADARDPIERFNYYASELWYRGYSFFDRTTRPLLDALIQTSAGKLTILRLGVMEKEYLELAKDAIARGEPLPLDEFLDSLRETTPPQRDISFADLFVALIEAHPTLSGYLAARSISKNIAYHTAEWVESELNRIEIRRRWWLRTSLGRIPGVGKGLAYGKTWYLQQYGYNLAAEALRTEDKLIGKERQVELLEAALLKSSGANAIIVGEPGAGKHTVLLGLTKMIVEGKIFPELEHWQVWKIHGGAIIAAGKTKGEVSAILLKLFDEALRAGNIIFTIDEFPEFIDGLEKLGVNALEIFSPYLASSAIHIVGLADTISFRRILEQNEGLMKYFERVNISEPDAEELIQILEDWVPKIESSLHHRIIITYSAIQKITEGATNYLIENALPQRAVELLKECATEAMRRRISLVTPELVMEILEIKTKMPLGEISKAEQEKLLKLEEILHRRVIDQEEAIRGIADAIKRARAGVRNPKRPIGSFLFLGPTGVGKTETSKALAEVYFGNEERMERFDMTEFQDENSVARLIGSFEKNEPGILASRMRMSPYGVVLLDEFEKSHPKVKNLFLQILDEGFFSDYLGEKVNMRNTIIIATSNAGSQIIWELTEKGQDVTTVEREIIAYIQKERILTPELINRFDAVIIFRPLSREMLKEIAKIMLGRLVERLKTQNITLKITEELIEAVAKGGYDPAFGARPMQRFVQDKIEKVIAERIIRGEIKAGSEFSLSKDEI